MFTQKSYMRMVITSLFLIPEKLTTTKIFFNNWIVTCDTSIPRNTTRRGKRIKDANY